MTQTTNSNIVRPSDNFDQRVQDYFNNYYTTEIRLTDNEYEHAKSFFIARTDNEEAAAALTAGVIQAANELGMFLSDVIEEFQKTGNLKQAVPTFLNLSREGNTLLGYESDIQPTENTKRQVEA